MADADYFDDLTEIPRLIAEDIIATSKGMDLDAAYLTAQTSEITYQSQTAGPDILTITLIDPDWVIQCSGLCDVDGDGMLQQVDINFPNGTDVWWRLSEVINQGGDLSTAALQLVFYHRFVVYLQNDWGPLKVAPKTTTRAQFVKQLADRIPNSLPKGVTGPGSDASQRITFICPELDIVQAFAGQGSTSSTTKTAAAASTTKAQVNKTKGIGYGADITIQGAKAGRNQIDNINAALGVCDSLNAGPLATLALTEACIAESGFGNPPPGGAGEGPSAGILQFDASGPYAVSFYQSVTESVTHALQEPGATSKGGMIGLAQKHPDWPAYQIAQTEQGSGAGAASNGASNYGVAEAEAKNIISAYGGSSDGSQGSTNTKAVTSDIGQLARGSSGNADEDSWTCLTRLASEVNWELFTTARPVEGQWGNYMYYMTGPTNDKQMPSAYLIRSDETPGTWDLKASTKKTVMTATNVLTQQPAYTFDNTAFIYQTTKTRKGKLQRKVEVVKPQTPSQCQINLVSAPFEYNAGDVFVFSNSGPLNGRWIVTDVTRNLLADDFNQITLGPPTSPNAEPASTATSSTTSTGTAAHGSLAKAVELAKAAATLEAQKKCYTYTQGAGRTNNGNGVVSPPYSFDCSGFCGAVYKFAGLACPYGAAGYGGVSGDVNTGGACTQVSQGGAVPGDLVTFGANGKDHVAIWIGGGNVINMGDDPNANPASPDEPYITSLQGEIDSHSSFAGFWHLKNAK